jgi:hypothetical protein
MKLMTVTKETQGWRTSDFCHGEEGEIAIFGFECDSDKDDVDGRCGCRRSMGGMKSQKGSTTMEIKEIDITPKQLRERIQEYLVETKWAGLLTAKELKEYVADYQKDLMRIGEYFPEGAIVEKRGDDFRNRKEGSWRPTP